MNVYAVLGASIAESVGAVGTAVSRLARRQPCAGPAASGPGWTDQFSDASHDDRRSRRTVDALFRAATVRT